MKKNVGTVDQIVRILLAVVIAVLYFNEVITSTTAIILLVVAGVLVLTSFINFCPIYFFLGISSRKKGA